MSFSSWGGEKYRNHFAAGTYNCSKCNAALFNSTHKFEHHSPWPAFSHPVTERAIRDLHRQGNAVKIACAACGQKLGHEFRGEGPGGASRF